MLETINKVTLVCDRKFGERLHSIASVSHVWIIDTPCNRRFAEDFWRRQSADALGGKITTFKVPEGTTDCSDILDTIDLHHGVFSSNPPYAVFEVIGLPLSPPLRSRIRKLGFTLFEPTDDGFCAIRASTTDY